MRIITLIDEAAVIERILRHPGLWEVGVRVESAREPARTRRDYDNEPVSAEN